MVSQLSGTWYNQHGSQLKVEAADGGRLAGTFRSGVGLETAEHEATGYVSGDLIVFCVNFGEHDSLTCWSGHRVVDADGGESLETMWHMTVATSHPQRAEDVWKGTWSGADTFRRQPPSRRAAAPGQARVASHPRGAWLTGFD